MESDKIMKLFEGSYSSLVNGLDLNPSVHYGEVNFEEKSYLIVIGWA